MFFEIVGFNLVDVSYIPELIQSIPQSNGSTDFPIYLKHTKPVIHALAAEPFVGRVASVRLKICTARL
jgi:hypothetical protein